MTERILENIATFQMRGSNWVFTNIISLELHTVKYEQLKGSAYIPLPLNLAKKEAIINMKNKDDECFKCSVTRALHPVQKHAERITRELKEQAEQLIWDNVTFPVDLKTIDRFERQNVTISVNVFGYEGEVYPLRLRKHEHEKIINILLISDGEKQHYCLIKNMSRLLSTQTSKTKCERHFSLRCLNSFFSKESLEKHEEYCKSNATVKVEMPEEGTTLKFKHFFKSMKIPFVVYADFESFTQKLDTTQPNPEHSYTNRYQKHTPSGFCYYIKCFDDEVHKGNPVIYTMQSEDEDISQIFVDSLEQSIVDIYTTNSFPKKMIITSKQQKAFEKATVCWICEKYLDEDRVRDHCHFTGKYRGAAHNQCNLRYQKPKFTPVIFHSLSGYDSHLFIKNLGEKEGKIDCIPNNEEKYISFTNEFVIDSFTNKDGDEKEVKHELRIIDSFKFMASSLDKLVGNLQKFVNLESEYEGEQLSLLTRKGVYPYDYVDGLERLAEVLLPPKEEFYSKLSGDDISDEDYVHAQLVWKEFKCKTMRDYHNLYLTSDVLLLADVFETFRDVCLTNYNLDPAWYYTAPGLAWDAALKYTDVELELLSDSDMLLMIEKGIRGGVSSIMTRNGKANNKYMGEMFDPKEPSKHLQYMDANNLYGWAMSKPLPTHGCQWMTEGELNVWENHSCFLEVDLEYPKELHDLHNEYPLAPEWVVVNKIESLCLI